MNIERYPWLQDLESPQAREALDQARQQYNKTGAFILPRFITNEALIACRDDAQAQEEAAFTTNDVHTAYLKDVDQNKPAKSVYNHLMRTKVASIAYDELPRDSQLSQLYNDPRLLALVSKIVDKHLYLSKDPLGCCSINVFRPGYYHSFHFDESDFSTTLMLQCAEDLESGLFQYTYPLRQDTENDLAAAAVAKCIQDYSQQYEENQSAESLEPPDFFELNENASSSSTLSQQTPILHTLDFQPGTLSIFSGSKSLHRVTKVNGDSSRLVAVLTFATKPGFCNSAKVQKLFWGRSVDMKINNDD